MERVKLGIFCFLLFMSVTRLLEAQEILPSDVDRNNPEVVFAYQGEAVLTQSALDGAFESIPEEHRLVFIRDGAKVDRMVKSLLQSEIIALDAELSGFALDPAVQARVMLAARKELAEAWIEHVTDTAPPADYAAMAYEDYLLHPDLYATMEMVDVTHILISSKERNPDEAAAIALDLRERLEQDPSQFDSLVAEFSEDPGSASTGGRYTGVQRGQMVKPFEDAAFALQFVGEISAPVNTEYGYHLIRLDKKVEPEPQAFEVVKDEAIEKAKAKHLTGYRTRYMQNLLQYPIVIPAGSVEIMARRYFGEDLSKAPIFTEEGVQ